MKKTITFIKILSLTATILLIGTLFTQAQNLGGCANNPTNNINYSVNDLDGYLSDAWNKYKRPENWSPNSSTPIKTIKINYVICRKDDGSGGWIDNSEFRSQVDLMINKLNENFSNVPEKGYSVECEPSIDYITDTKIRFELNEIIFIDDTELHHLDLFSAQPIIDYLDANYPEHVKAMNHIFTMPEEDDQCCGNAWGNYNYDGDNLYIHTRNSMWSETTFYWEDHETHFRHEYGHALGLQHTYNAEYTDVSHYDFLDDIFGTCADPDYCDPVPPPGYVCYLDKDYFIPQPTPYPIMGGQLPNKYISPKQAGRMHRDLMFYDYVFVTLNNPIH